MVRDADAGIVFAVVLRNPTREVASRFLFAVGQVWKLALHSKEAKSTGGVAIAYAKSLAMQDSAAMTFLRVVAIAADDGGMWHLQMAAGTRGLAVSTA